MRDQAPPCRQRAKQGIRSTVTALLRYAMLSTLLVAGALFVVTGHAHAQFGKPAEPPSATVRLEPATLRLDAGTPAEFTVRLTPPAGHHAYLDAGKDGTYIPIEIDTTALAQAGLRVRPVGKPQGEADAQLGATVLRGAGVFRYRLSAPSGAKAGTRDYAIAVRSQICNDATGSCYFPRTDTMHLQVIVNGAPAQTGGVQPSETPAPAPVPPAPSPVAVTDPPPPPSVVDTAPKTEPAVDFSQYTPRTNPSGHSLPAWLLLAFVAGLVMNIMPCVLPVVSIKVLSFVQQAGESRGRVLGLGLFFAAGMITVFLALAAAAILFGLGWGQQFQSPVFLIVMIALVFAFALSLFGVYEFGVPSAVGSLAAGAPREGYGSAYLKGVLATLLATPCSGPLLGSTLAWTLTQPPPVVLAIFGMLGLGMALPYVVLTAQPALLKRLPKPGPWMETFKHLMGFLLVGTVVYLMISLDQTLLLFTVMLLVFVATGAWVWGRFALRARSSAGRVLVLASALLIVGAGAYLSFHTLRNAVQPPAVAADASIAWEPFDPVKLAQYHREGRSVLLDFTADWCANCQFNEARVYNSAPVRALLRDKHVVAMQADLTREGPSTAAIRRLMTQLGARSIPFLAVFPGDQPTRPYTLYDLVDRETVRSLLQQLPDGTVAP